VHERIEAANRMLCESTDDEKFVTLFYAELDPRSHRVTWCNAGHEPPYLFSPDSGVSRLNPDGIALGVMEAIGYDERALDLSPGGTMVIYSDGVPDATNASDEAFGTDRLVEIIAANGQGSAGEMVEAIVTAVTAHAGGAPQFDDVTVVVIKRS
jgi:serine phosphatase RsbU (regulator of sigma subunit)